MQRYLERLNRYGSIHRYHIHDVLYLAAGFYSPPFRQRTTGRVLAFDKGPDLDMDWFTDCGRKTLGQRLLCFALLWLCLDFLSSFFVCFSQPLLFVVIMYADMRLSMYLSASNG